MSSLLLRKEKTRDLTLWRLENANIALTVYPELGGKIYDLVYKPLDRNLLWHNDHVPLSRVAFGSSFDDVFQGGWDELFPNDEEAAVQGYVFPDHGEVWSIPWRCRPQQAGNRTGLLMEVTGPVTGVHLRKEISLSTANPDRIYFRHRLEHRGRRAFPFLWKLHPAFAISPRHRIDLPPNRMKLDLEYSTTPDTRCEEFDWPICPDRIGRPVDLRQIPPPGAGTTLFAYGTDLKEGWFALTDPEHDLGFAFRFPHDIFPTCWLFASFGGWRSHYCLLIEPCTGYPYRLEEAVRMGTCPVLQPGQVIEFECVGTCFSGLTEVQRVTPSGQVL